LCQCVHVCACVCVCVPVARADAQAQRGELVGQDRAQARYWYFGGPRLYVETRDSGWATACASLGEWEALHARASGTDRRLFPDACRVVRVAPPHPLRFLCVHVAWGGLSSLSLSVRLCLCIHDGCHIGDVAEGACVRESSGCWSWPTRCCPGCAPPRRSASARPIWRLYLAAARTVSRPSGSARTRCGRQDGSVRAFACMRASLCECLRLGAVVSVRGCCCLCV
jgi:hypothetical protein